MKSMVTLDMKCYNRRIVFEVLQREKAISRSELGRAIGMSAPTVFKIVQDFTEKGIVIPSGELSVNLGRRPLLLRFNPDAYYVAGVELEGTRMRAGLFNLNGEVRASVTRDVPSGFSMDTGNEIAQSLNLLIERVGCLPVRVAALGIGLPGVVDVEKNIIRFAPLIGINEPVDVSDVLKGIRQQTKLTAHLENDANAAAYGEMITRRPECDGNLLYLTLGTGLGSGLILDGLLRRGSRFMAGEMGYWVGDSLKTANIQSPGWLEGCINLPALEKQFGYSPGGSKNQDMVRYMIDLLAPAVANMTNMLDIDLVVLDGLIFEDIGDSFIPIFEKQLSGMTIQPVEIKRARCMLPGPMGAAMLAFHGTFEKWLGTDGAPEEE